METISQRNDGGRHRQDGDEHDRIPAPRSVGYHAGGPADEWDDWDGGWHGEDASWEDGRRDNGDGGPVDPPFGSESHRAVADTTGTGSQHAAGASAPLPVVAEARPRRRRAAPSGWTARRIGWAAAGLAAVFGLVLAAVVVAPEFTRDVARDVPVSVAAPVPAEAAFGERLQRTDGWTVEIDEPRALKASDDIDLPSDADRGVVLDVLLTNTATEPRGTAGWTVKAIVGSTPVDVLPDAGAPSRTIRPGASMTFRVTVPMPDATTDLQLEAAPAAGVPSLFVGTA